MKFIIAIVMGLSALLMIVTLNAASLTESRGYLVTPDELQMSAELASTGVEPYASAIEDLRRYADLTWDFQLDRIETCPSADSPIWLDDNGGIPIVYAKALMYHLDNNDDYGDDVVDIIAEIIAAVEAFSLDDAQCRLNLSWGIPEIVASADLVSEKLTARDCAGPLNSDIDDDTFGRGNCKILFQNWLAKIPYHIVSLSAEGTQNNWGASGTNTAAYIADYLWDRDDVTLIHRMPVELNEDGFIALSPAAAYDRNNQLALDRMNGYRVDYMSSFTCDRFETSRQLDTQPPIKSQITPEGILPEEARREQYCNIEQYNSDYQNYPQLHLGSNIQQCELMLRRGNSECYDNMATNDLPDYTFANPTGGDEYVTHLRPQRGSIERAVNAIIVDAQAEWRHDAALEVALKYYANGNSQFNQLGYWLPEIDTINNCSHDICFATISHGIPVAENDE